jgi:hypothetical protein
MKVVIFNGPPGSGKDTCCEIISKGTQVRHYSLASILKKATHSLFGINYLPENYFEGEIKEQESDLFGGLSPRQAYIKMSEEMVKPVLGADFFAETSIRMIEQDPLVKTAVCFSDCGFQNEFEVFVKKYGVKNVMLVHIEREGCDFSNDSRNYVTPVDGMQYQKIVNNGTLKDLADRVEQSYKWIIGE